jgi:hypothetical protein
MIHNRRTLALSFVALMLIFSACKKLKTLTEIKKTVDYSEETDLPDIPRVGAFPPQGVTMFLPSLGIATNSKQFAAENETAADLITSVKARKLGLDLLKPENGTFDYVDTLRLYASAPGVAERLVAYKYAIPKGLKTIEMEAVDTDLKDMFVQDSMFFRLQGHFYDFPDSNTRVRMNATFTVTANPLN